MLCTDLVVATPSATIFMPFKIESRLSPFPILIPTDLFLLKSDAAVSIKSPKPDNPVKVCLSAPNASPNLVISTIPRVKRAALALFPNPSPSDMPAARAIIFFSAPPNSTPLTSFKVYILKFIIFLKKNFNSSKILSLNDAIQTAVGRCLETSAAKLGPLKTAYLSSIELPRTLSKILCGSSIDLSPNPFAVFTNIQPLRSNLSRVFFMSISVFFNAIDGTARNIMPQFLKTVS